MCEFNNQVSECNMSHLYHIAVRTTSRNKCGCGEKRTVNGQLLCVSEIYSVPSIEFRENNQISSTICYKESLTIA